MEPQKLKELLAPYQAIRDGAIQRRLVFYERHVNQKRRYAEYSGHTLLFLSLLIPVVANFHFEEHWVNSMIVSILSLLIALITGIRESTQWARLWRVYSHAIVQIENLLASWELEIAKARLLDDSTKVTEAVENATKILKDSVERIVQAEMDSFFTSIPKRSTADAPQQGEPGPGT